MSVLTCCTHALMLAGTLVSTSVTVKLASRAARSASAAAAAAERVVAMTLLPRARKRSTRALPMPLMFCLRHVGGALLFGVRG